ncbi:MAG: efflux RND transporter periplasmic adaptor subunit [Spirochaetaceae bacterium]|nr:MAG: efflux RND transporter periplasmic adaptor subunit [Spirochaetaceae bacterium]
MKSRVRVGRGAALRGPVVVVAVVLLFSCGFLPEEEEYVVPSLPEPPRVAAVVTYPVEREDIFDVIEGTARVSPVRETMLYFEANGRVQSLSVQPNQRVSRGEVLARLEIDSILHNLKLGEIDLKIAEANLEKMDVAGTVPIDRRIQQLVVDRHAAVVERHRSQIDRATIRAPHDGVVRRVQIQVADTVREHEPVIEIADPDEVELQMTVSEENYRAIDALMEAEVQVERESWEPVEITRTTHLNPRFDSSVRREQFIVHFTMPESGHLLRPFSQHAMRVYKARQEDALVIPSAALREFRGREYVRVLDGDMRREVDVRVGIRSATRVEIVEGLSEDDVVIGR